MTSKDKTPGKALAMVLLSDQVNLSADSFLTSWRSVWPDLAEPAGVRSDVGAANAATLTFEYQGFVCAVAMMPAPIPAAELEAPILSAWLWPNAAETVPGSAAHLIVFVSGEGSTLEAFSVLTKVVASSVKATDAMGVYWGSAGLLVRADVFVELAQEQESEPLMIWVNFRASRDGTGNLLATEGMDAFGLMEIEAFRVERSIEELRELAMVLAWYLIENGPIVEDGSTFGRSESEKIRVHHVPSRYDRTKTVYRLDGL